MLAERPGAGGTASTPALLGLVYVHRATYGAEGDARLAQAVRNALVNRLGEPSRPAFALTLTVSRSIAGAATTLANRITHETLSGTATFSLQALNQEGAAPPKPLISGSETAWANQDRLDSAYADRMVERDMERRVADGLADQIQRRLAGYFASR